MKIWISQRRVGPVLLFAAALSTGRPLWSQAIAAAPLSVASNDSLPDAPSALFKEDQATPAAPAPATPAVPVAPCTPAAPGAVTVRCQAKHLSVLIEPEQDAAPITPRMKFEMSIRKQATFGELGSAAAAAAYGNWRDLRPHYGTDARAFGQRFGAALVRQTSQSVFYVGLFSTVFRQDPRYYVLGPTHSFKSRVGYAASRVVVTRTDAGRNAPNVSLFAGVLSASLLTDAYYPQQDRDTARAVRSAAFSLMYRLATQQLKEFHREILHTLHLKRS